MSMHLRNSRDMMTTDDAGWWVSKTPLEQKLIILSSVLFILSFCLTISVIVLDNRKPPACPSTSTTTTTTTTLKPPTNTSTSTSSTASSESTDPTADTPTTPVSSTTNQDGDGDKGDARADVSVIPGDSMKSFPPDVATKEDRGEVKDTSAKAWADGNPTPETSMASSPNEDPSSRQV